MGKRDAVDRVDDPVTASSLATDTGELGMDAEATLVDQSALVDFAVDWFEPNR